MNGRAFIYGSIAAFTAAQASALAIDDVVFRTALQFVIGFAMFFAGLYTKPSDLTEVTSRRRVEPPKKEEPPK